MDDRTTEARKNGIEDVHALFSSYMRDEEGFYQFLVTMAAEDAEDDSAAGRRRLVGALYTYLWTTHGLINALIRAIEQREDDPSHAEVVTVWEALMKNYKATLGIEWTPPSAGAYE